MAQLLKASRCSSFYSQDTFPGQLKIAPFELLAFDRFEQRLEIPFAEAAAALALDDLEEQRRTILHGPRKDLQHVALIISIDKNAELLKFVDRLINRAHPRLQFGVIRVRHA